MRQYKLESRRKSANERVAIYSKLTIKQKIDLLDKKLGKGVGAKKQRAKLTKNTNKPSQPKVAPKEVKKSKVPSKSPKEKFTKGYNKEEKKEN